MLMQVVLASQGYPGSYQKGSAIRGLDSVSTAKVSSMCRMQTVRSLGCSVQVQLCCHGYCHDHP